MQTWASQSDPQLTKESAAKVRECQTDFQQVSTLPTHYSSLHHDFSLDPSLELLLI